MGATAPGFFSDFLFGTLLEKIETRETVIQGCVSYADPRIFVQISICYTS